MAVLPIRATGTLEKRVRKEKGSAYAQMGTQIQRSRVRRLRRKHSKVYRLALVVVLQRAFRTIEKQCLIGSDQLPSTSLFLLSPSVFVRLVPLFAEKSCRLLST